MKPKYRGCGIPTAVALSLILWALILITLSSCTSMEECEEQVGNQYQYEVISLDSNGYEIDRQFCNSYITLYGDSMTTFSYDYCNLHKKIKTDRFRLKIGTYKINRL